MTVLELAEALTGKEAEVNLHEIEEMLSEVAPTIFGDAPYYNPDGKQEFQVKFLKNFLFREICTTPWAKWAIMLQARMAEIMPLYSEIWATAQWKYNPLENVNMYTDGDKKAQENTDVSHNQTSGYDIKVDNTTDFTENTKEQIETTGEGHATGNSTTNTTDNSDVNTDTTAHNDTTTKNDSTVDSTTNTTDNTKTVSEQTGSSHETTSGTSNNLQRFSDTPQNDLGIEYDNLGNIVMAYLTNVTSNSGSTNGRSDTDTTNDTTVNSDSTSNSTGNQVTTSTGESHSDDTGNSHTVSEATSNTTVNTKTDENTTGTSDLNRDVISKNIFDETTGQTAHEEHTTGTDFTHSDDWREHRVGHEATHTYQNLVKESRELIVEYDKQIFELCSDLFFQLY